MHRLFRASQPKVEGVSEVSCAQIIGWSKPDFCYLAYFRLQCFYPNWGATSLPEEPAASIETAEESETSPEPEVSVEPTESPTPEETKTAEPVIERLPANVVILIADAYLDTGMLEVVAQVQGTQRQMAPARCDLWL